MELYNYQNKVTDAMLAGKNIILQAPTGAGKTFASLYPFFQNWADKRHKFPRKCVYSVPMRVLANQFLDEYRKMIDERFKAAVIPDIKRQTGEFREDTEFRADITFATIDQVLSSWLMHPYSLSKRKGNLNAGAFVGSYLIFDEFHLFDPDSTLPTTLHMLKTLKGVSPFLLMTATFSREMLLKLADALDAEPIVLSDKLLADIKAQRKTRYFYTVDRPLVADDQINVELIVEKHLAQSEEKQRTLVVCNQVEKAQKVFKALKHHPQLSEDVEIILLHSRYLRSDRQTIEETIRQEFNKDKDVHTQRSVILIGTQVVEVGLDMSSAALHTELAPGAAILQRAGRCARYEGEEGAVYVYKVPDDDLAPYHKKESKNQCHRTWEWLMVNQGRHISFSDEQALIDHAHTPTDALIIEGLLGTSSQIADRVHKLWRGDGNQGDANRLIRDIQASSVIITSNPDAFVDSPFSAESFSLHPGTLKGKFKHWEEKNNGIDPDFEDGHLPWLAAYLHEVEDDQASQGNQPIQYEFVPVKHSAQLQAPLIAIQPSLVGYSKELGLMLEEGSFYETPIPEQKQASERPKYGGYLLESYEKHIELVLQAYDENDRVSIDTVGRRLERRYGWQSGIVSRVMALVVVLHDVGKLSTGWQGWAREWQASSAVGHPMPHNMAAAHTDYNPMNQAQVELNKKLRGKRPNHAVESAVAGYKMLLAILPDKSHEPLAKAAFSAIARHHGAFTSEAGSYQLDEGFADHVENTLALIETGDLSAGMIRQQLNYSSSVQNKINQHFLINMERGDEVLSYMLFARALRTADQKGTEKGSRN